MDTEISASTGSEGSSGSSESSGSTGSSETASTESSQSETGAETRAEGGTPSNGYTPNFKFKVHDKEKEFDPAFKDFIKDKKTEDLIRDLYTKGDGLGEVKEKYQRVNESYKTLHQEHTNLNNTINNLSKMVSMNDFDSFFDAIKIPQEQVLRWVQKKLQMMEMPPDQRQAIEQQQQAQKQAIGLQEQNQNLQSNLARQQTEFREFQVQTVLRQPDVQPIVEAFEAKNGPRSFLREVALRGLAHYNATGVDIPAEQAVREVISLLSYGGQPTPQAQAVTSAGPQVPAATPVIPHVQARGASSPARKVMRSLSDLKKAAADMG